MRPPQLSVIVPTYARPAATLRAVGSALAQDVDLEVIVVDDGSPAPFAFDADERVSVVRIDRNNGAAAARNAGAAVAKSDWLAFLDSDDVWTLGSLRPRFEAARAAHDPSRTIWAAGFRDVWPDGRRSTRIPVASANPMDFACGCWSCPGSTALLSRAAWERSGGQDASLRRLEDYEWLMRWGASGGQLAVYPNVAAEVTRGRWTDPDQVVAAGAHIRRVRASSAKRMRRRMEAYLALENGAAFVRAGQPLAGTLALARSWLLRPRLRVALKPFWMTLEQALEAI